MIPSMKHYPLILLFIGTALSGADPNRLANTVILDETGVKNLGIETVEAEETTFEETVFSLGRIEVLPGNRAVVSSRIPGRAFSVLALPDQTVDEGEELMWVESRQPGDPPPKIMLEMARDVSEGMPTSHGSQYLGILVLAIHHQGCTNRHISRSCMASKMGKSSGWFRLY